MSNIITSGILSLDSEMTDLMAACYNSTELFAGTILSERFYRPFDPLHRQIFEIIDDDTLPLAAIAAPRGIGKTSIVNLAVPAKKILFDDSSYIVPVSCSATVAVQQSENLKVELMGNELVTKMFNPIKSDVFSKEQWVANNHIKTCVMPRGAQQQIRGLLYRNHRPSLIIVDDLEDPEEMDSEDQRKKKKDWFYADLMNCIDMADVSRGKWRIIVLGTILHEDSLLVDLLDDEDWESITLSLCNDKLETNAPNFMSTESVLKLYNRYKRKNKLGIFYREHMNKVVATEEAKFRQEYFKYYGVEDNVDYTITEEELNNDRDVINVVMTDPARSLTEESADTAIIGVGINTLTKAVFIREVNSGKFFPDEIYQNMFDMAARINAKVLAYEDTGLKEFISYPLKNMALSQGLIFTYIELKPRKGKMGKGSGKIARVASMSPMYKAGYVYHRFGSVCQKLEGQLLSFPKSKMWDEMDIVGYITELLDSGQLFFAPDDTGDDLEAAAAEMEELKNMENDGPLDYMGII